MSFMDSLKRQAGQTPSAPGERTVVLRQLPVNLAQLQAMPEASLQEPQYAAALAIAALCVYPIDREAALEMLHFLQGPRGLTPYDKQFLADRFRDKDYVPRSYFDGATPQNNYEPTEPLTLRFFEGPYSRANIGEGYLTLYIRSGGADSPRELKLRNKPSTGQWFLWEQMLLSGIREPVSADPWA